MSKHTITAEIEVKHQPAGMGLPDDEFEVSYPKVEIEFNFIKGDPGCIYQRNGDPGWPPEPAEVEAISAKLIDGDGLVPTQQQIDDWAADWLDGPGYEQAVEAASVAHSKTGREP